MISFLLRRPRIQKNLIVSLFQLNQAKDHFVKTSRQIFFRKYLHNFKMYHGHKINQKLAFGAISLPAGKVLSVPTPGRNRPEIPFASRAGGGFTARKDKIKKASDLVISGERKGVHLLHMTVMVITNKFLPGEARARARAD